MLSPHAGLSAAAPGGQSASGAGPTANPGPTSDGTTIATSGPGYSAREIFVGVAYDSTYSKELGAVGVSSGSTSVGDQKAQVNALVGDINARGGVLGRKLVPVFYDTNGLNTQNDPNSVAQAACAAWTQDRRVFAAMTFVVQMDNEALYQCLSKRGVIFVPLGGESTPMFAQYSPYLWAPAGLSPERLAPTWIARLQALQYFGGWDTTLGKAGTAPAKIGLLYGNGVRNGEPGLDAAFVRSVKKALAEQGRSVTSEYQITNNQADEAAAVLRFHNAGVTHVIGDFSIVNFTQGAESQRYRPRYGLTSFSPGTAMKLFAPPSQLNGALGVGWIPSADVDAAQDPGDISPAETRCRKVMHDAGQPTSTRLAWFAMTLACDTFNFLAAAIPPSRLSPKSFPEAAAMIGSIPPAATFSITFGGTRRDGVGAVRDIAYGSSCGCFAYLDKQNHQL